jgi:transposase-like protein
MTDEIRRLRSAAHHLARGKAPRAIRYPAAFRAAATAVTRTQVSQGTAVSRVATALGLPTRTLLRWLATPARPGLRPVAIASAPEEKVEHRATPVLITPRGVRVEGLERDALVAVLLALG